MDYENLDSSEDDDRSLRSIRLTRSQSNDKAVKRKRDDSENITVTTVAKKGKKISSNTGKAKKQTIEITVVDDDEILFVPEQSSHRLRKKDTHTLATAKELRNMSLDDIKDLGSTWLEDIEKMWKKSKNLNGVVSGIIGDRVLSLKDLLQCLVKKAQFNGDSVFYQMRLEKSITS